MQSLPDGIDDGRGSETRMAGVYLTQLGYSAPTMSRLPYKTLLTHNALQCASRKTRAEQTTFFFSSDSIWTLWRFPDGSKDRSNSPQHEIYESRTEGRGLRMEIGGLGGDLGVLQDLSFVVVFSGLDVGAELVQCAAARRCPLLPFVLTGNDLVLLIRLSGLSVCGEVDCSPLSVKSVTYHQ
jgi:hypothetical protein